jgi:hypothetical protein
MYEDVVGMEVFFATAADGLPILPLEVVPDWDRQVRQAEDICRLIDGHLDHAAHARGLINMRQIQPLDLGPEPRVQMVTDVRAAVDRDRGER